MHQCRAIVKSSAVCLNVNVALQPRHALRIHLTSHAFAGNGQTGVLPFLGAWAHQCGVQMAR